MPSRMSPTLRDCLAALLLFLGMGSAAAAAEFVEGFDGPRTTWQIRCNESECRVLSHRRHAQILRKGTGSENVELVVARQITPVQLEHRLPPSRVLPELTASLWVRSNRSGAVLGLRLVFPHIRDPDTGKIVTRDLHGDAYTQAGSWQLLTCRTTEKEVESRIRLLRAQLGSNIDTRDMYVDRALISLEAGKGATELFLDELRLTPVVTPTEGTPLLQPEEQLAPTVEVRLDRLLVEGRTFFPRIIAWHGEPLERLAALQFNPIWISDSSDTDALRALKSLGVFAMATPPRAVSPTGDVLDAESAGLTPFGPESDPILFWNLGTGIAEKDRRALESWRSQLLRADRRMKRPLVADVSGAEGIYSRLLPMMGTSRWHMQQTDFSYRRYRDWLIQRHRLSRHGSFLWTWIQTEPHPALTAGRDVTRKNPLILEPEQIRLQTYSALAAGCRGLGFWTTRGLDQNQPGDEERRLILQQLNYELLLLEDWLATGNLLDQIPITLTEAPRAADQVQRRQKPSRAPSAVRGQNEAEEVETPPENVLEAAMFRTDYGLLLLPVWYSRDAQFVPGQMTAKDVRIIVPGVTESATVWEISTTHMRSMPRHPVAEGIEVTLPLLDMTAAIVISSDQNEISRLRRKMEELRPRSAAACLSLAEAKLARVIAVDRELQGLKAGLPDSERMIAKADNLLSMARRSWEQQDYHHARLFSGDACRMLRILQQAHWQEAAKSLSSPVASPHTISFQSLPDHWRLIHRIGRGTNPHVVNLLHAGDFEDPDTLLAEDWRHDQNETDGIRATAELYARPRSGNYCLRLIAAPDVGKTPPVVVPAPPVSVTTPAVTVRSGQIVHIGGWVRIAAPVIGSLDGAILYDSLTGPAGALRWHEPGEWQRFEMLREVQQSGEMRVKMELTGLGEVHFDDIRIIPLEPLDEVPPSPRQESPREEAAPETSSGINQLLPRLPRLRKGSSGGRDETETRDRRRP